MELLLFSPQVVLSYHARFPPPRIPSYSVGFFRLLDSSWLFVSRAITMSRVGSTDRVK